MDIYGIKIGWKGKITDEITNYPTNNLSKDIRELKQT